MSVNLIFHENSKHIEIWYHFMHDMVSKGALELQYVPTNDQTTAVLTKPLPKVKFEYFHGILGVEENVSLLERER